MTKPESAKAITIHEAAIDIVLLCFAASNDEERYFKVMAKLRDLMAGFDPIQSPAASGKLRRAIDRNNHHLAGEFCRDSFQKNFDLSDERTQAYASIVYDVLELATDFALTACRSVSVTEGK